MINAILSDKVKLLASCRTNIFQHQIVQTLGVLSKFSCDFLSTDNSLDDDERQNIAHIYLRKDEIRLLESVNVFSKFDFFPLLCRYYSIQRSGNIVEFFSNPIKAVSDDLYPLMTAFDQTTFETLFLFVVYNNYIPKSLFNEKLKLKATLEDISDHFVLKCKFSIQVVKDEIKRLRNSYIRRQNNVYRIFNDKIFDILAYFCSLHKCDLMLDKAHTKVIRDRFVFKSSIGKFPKSENLVEIQSKMETHYFERLKKDIEQGSSYYEPSNIEKSHLQISICNVKYSFLPYKSYEISPLQIAASKVIHI